MLNPSLVFLLNLISTWYLVGLIWIVQIVHYPLFDRVGAREFEQYEADHNRLITPVVGPVMLVELASALALIVASPAGFPRWAAWLGVGLIATIWLSTVLIQVPCHNQLSSGFQEFAYRRLVGTNWIRTVCWSARGVLVAYFAWRMIEVS